MQTMEHLIAANVVIGDRSYRIRVEPKDEEIVRKTVKTINDKIIEYKTHFAGKDMQDYIAMVLVWYATEQAGGAVSEVEQEHLLDKLNSIERMLDSTQ